MSRTTVSIRPRNPLAGAVAFHTLRPVLRTLGRLAQLHGPDSAYARERPRRGRQHGVRPEVRQLARTWREAVVAG